MSLPRTHSPAPSSQRSSCPAASRRGSVYVLVLATATIAAAAGLGALAIAQSSQRSALASAEWNRASVAAQSALELAVTRLNTDSMWRTALTSGFATSNLDISGARARLLFVDENDGDFTAGTHPIRIYAAAGVGSSLRVLSLQCEQRTPTALDALRCALYASQAISNGGTLAGGGVMSSGTHISNSGSMTASLEAPTISNTGTVRGFIVSGAQSKTMPASSIAQSLAARATQVPNLLSNTTYSTILWSNDRSPALVTNAAGLYAITISDGRSVTLSNLRIRATLIVTLGINAQLIVKDSVLWEPAGPTYPSLVVIGDAGSVVNLSGNNNTLKETALNNYNPTGTPYAGVSDTDTTDAYPCILTGVFHIMGSSLQIGDNFNLRGCIITDGQVVIAGTTAFASDPSLLTSPPTGYTDIANIRPVRGSVRWETAASFNAAQRTPSTPDANGNLLTDLLGGLLR